MQKSTLYMLGLASLLITATISLSVVSVRAADYLPAVVPGQFAKYELLYFICDLDPSFCDFGSGGVDDLDWGALKVIEVSGTSVTLSMISVYKNGTATQDGALVDVATGFSNITAFGSASSTNYFVLAGGLQAPDPVWGVEGAPTLNETVTKLVLGSERTINILNFTSSSSYDGFSSSFSLEFEFDQASGVFIEAAFLFSTSSQFGSTRLEFVVGMIDNNIWLDSVLPDFSLDASPTTVSVEQGAAGTSTITITRIAGFSRAVTLTVASSPSVLSCSLTPETLSGSTDSSILSCAGPPGTYTVTVTGDGGYARHETSVVFNLAVSTAPDFTISNSGMVPFQAGSSGTATITLAALNGFSSAINLQVSSSPSGLSCSLDKNSVVGGGTATLTCQGVPGSYTVTITATGGSKSYTTQTTVTVTPVTTSIQPSGQQVPLLYIGAGIGALVIIVLAVLLLARRKPEEPQPI